MLIVDRVDCILLTILNYLLQPFSLRSMLIYLQVLLYLFYTYNEVF